jgi:hypothetical protein
MLDPAQPALKIITGKAPFSENMRFSSESKHRRIDLIIVYRSIYVPTLGTAVEAHRSSVMACQHDYSMYSSGNMAIAMICF